MSSNNLFPFSANIDIANVFLTFITSAQKESLLDVLIEEDHINLVQDSWVKSTSDALTNDTQKLMKLRNVNEPMSAIRKLVKVEEKELFCGVVKLTGKGRFKAVIVEEINHIIFENLKKKSTKLIYYFRKKLKKLMNEQKQKNSKMLHKMNELMNKNKSLKQRNKSLKQRNKSLKQEIELNPYKNNRSQNIKKINEMNTINESLKKEIIQLKSAIGMATRHSSNLQNELNQCKNKLLKQYSTNKLLKRQSMSRYTTNIFSSSNTYSSINKQV